VLDRDTWTLLHLVIHSSTRLPRTAVLLMNQMGTSVRPMRQDAARMLKAAIGDWLLCRHPGISAIFGSVSGAVPLLFVSNPDNRFILPSSYDPYFVEFALMNSLGTFDRVEGTIEHQPHIRFSAEIQDISKGTVCSRNV
jgi:hypothetical protein